MKILGCKCFVHRNTWSISTLRGWELSLECEEVMKIEWLDLGEINQLNFRIIVTWSLSFWSLHKWNLKIDVWILGFSCLNAAKSPLFLAPVVILSLNQTWALFQLTLPSWQGSTMAQISRAYTLAGSSAERNIYIGMASGEVPFDSVSRDLINST